MRNGCHQLLVDGIHLVDVDVGDFVVLLHIEAGVVALITWLRHHIAAAQYVVGQEDVDEALDVQRHLRTCLSGIDGDHQADRDVFGLQHPGERQGAQSAHRMADQDDRRTIVTEIADGLVRDQPADGEFVDVSPDAGFLETLGQAVHPARKDRAERAAEQIDARLRRGRGRRRVGRDRCDSIGRARDRTGDRQIANGRQDADGKGCTDHHGRNWPRTSHVHSARDLGARARRTLNAGRPRPRSADDLSSRNWQNLRHSSLRRRRSDYSRTAAVLAVPGLTALAAPGCRGFCAPERYRSAEDDGVDLAYHLPLHDLVFLDGHVPDARHVLHIDILELALELPGLRDRLAVAVGDVEVYVASHAPRELGAKHRIQADCQLNGSAKLIQLGDHVGQGGRSRGMPDQNDRLDLAALVSGGGFVGERRP